MAAMSSNTKRMITSRADLVYWLKNEIRNHGTPLPIAKGLVETFEVLAGEFANGKLPAWSDFLGLTFEEIAFKSEHVQCNPAIGRFIGSMFSRSISTSRPLSAEYFIRAACREPGIEAEVKLLQLAKYTSVRSTVKFYRDHGFSIKVNLGRDPHGEHALSRDLY
ncbi:hypothetical protein ACFFTN_09810 [Aminobacter aganoensis]|uniref:Uncharacterized protein n=1 Tax=Aminobacter aganoensis TaxID=83264 RepID=A0A7X0KMR5_9HYPH|nr:hypothetical protein [Aminobacter aganoensis]MBB6356324.1 hypothetical protein [Aminobacter aganoensis]